MARLHPPEFKTKVATALDMEGSWKEHPDLMYSVAREAAEAWATSAEADKLRRVQSRAKSAVARVGSARGGEAAVAGRGGQGSGACSGDLKPHGSGWNCGKEGHRIADCATKRKSGLQGYSNRPLLSLVVRPLGSSPLSSKVLSKEQARHPTRMERVHSKRRAYIYAHARRFLE